VSCRFVHQGHTLYLVQCLAARPARKDFTAQGSRFVLRLRPVNATSCLMRAMPELQQHKMYVTDWSPSTLFFVTLTTYFMH
jgi:hypothetical protein